jgi:hypothetical protein
MFDGQIPFGKSIDELFENTLEKNQTIHPTEVRKLQRYVRDNHTLVNRAMSILELFTHL